MRRRPELPRCSRCTRPAALDPCRRCATPTELSTTKDGIPLYPELPDWYRDLFPNDALRSVSSPLGAVRVISDRASA